MAKVELKTQKGDSDPPQGQDYEYHPLTGDNPIRLLYLEPDVHGVARYSLKSVDLTSKPEYNCLSYTWAYPQWKVIRPDTNPDPRSTGDWKKIQCDGQTICVGDNLASALARLREDDSQARTPMWIDAICIQQNYTPEKSAQVEKMYHIYQQAKKVIVWLGPEDEGYTPTAISVLNRLSTVLDENCSADIPSGLIDPEIYKRLGIPHISEAQWIAFGELLMRTWFSRMWVIQEMFQAREVTVYCGKHELEWAKIVEVSRLLQRTGLGQELMEYLDLNITDSAMEAKETNDTQMDMDGDVDEPVYVGNTLNNQWLFESLREQKAALKLETLLSYARYFSAALRSDYFYAVRGMWNPAREDIRIFRQEVLYPSYKLRTVEEVYTAATFAIIVEMGDLNVLSMVEDKSLRLAAQTSRQLAVIPGKKPEGVPEETEGEELPSWVPDWSITPIVKPLSMDPRPEKGSERWMASIGLPYTPYTTHTLEISTRKKLQVKGVFIATIDRTSAQEHNTIDWIRGMEIFAAEIFADLTLLLHILAHSASTVSDLVNTFWRTIIIDTYRDEKAGETARKAFASFLVVRIFEYEYRLVQYNSLAPNALDTPTPLDERFIPIETLLNELAARDPTGTIPNFGMVRQIIKEERTNVEFSGLNEEEKFFAESFRVANVGRRVFSTKENETTELRLGLGPRSLRIGDEVWVVAGVNIPMVLRREREGEWSLVGECYVHGIMDGEAVQDVITGRDRQGKKGEKELVDIILV